MRWPDFDSEPETWLALTKLLKRTATLQSIKFDYSSVRCLFLEGSSFYPFFRGFNKSTAACRTSLPLSIFINENKSDVKRRPLKFLNATKTARFLMPRTLEIAFPSL